MKDVLKLLALNLSVGVLFIMGVTFVLNGELAPALAYLNYTLTSLLVPAVVSAALTKALLLKEMKGGK